MRDRAESILKMPTAMFILSMHMLTLSHETHLTLFGFPMLTLNLVVNASGEDFILGSQSRPVHTYPAFSACQPFHFQLFSCDPCGFYGATKHLSSMLGVLHATRVPWGGFRRFILLPLSKRM
jgi:hypothetical protein